MQDRKRFLTTTLTVFFCAAISVAAFADDYYWDVADGDWSVGSNWDPSGPPTSADSVYIDNGGTVRLSDDAASNSFHVDDGLFIQDDGDLTIYSHQSFDGVSYANMSIGRNRYYTFNPDMSRIYHDGTYGEYNLLDGALTGDDDVSLDMDIYYGRFNQYGGTVDVSRIFMRSTEDVAEYNLYAGDLSAESLILSSDYLGNSVGGVFNQYGGSCELGSV